MAAPRINWSTLWDKVNHFSGQDILIEKLALKVHNMEKKLIEKQVSEIFKCKLCDFQTQSGSGLKIQEGNILLLNIQASVSFVMN